MTWDEFNKLHENESSKAVKVFRIAIMRHFEKMLEAAQDNNFNNLDLVLNRVSSEDIKKAFIKIYQTSGLKAGFIAYDEMTGQKKKARMYAGDTNVRNNWLSLLEGIALDETIPASGAILTTSQEIFIKFVDAAISEGKTLAQISAGLRNKFKELLPWRSWNIARTETLSALNYGSEIGAEQTGFNYKKTWVATLDGRERQAHRNATGQTVDRFSSFIVGGEIMKFPGDPSASPENRVNCRCTVTREVI